MFSTIKEMISLSKQHILLMCSALILFGHLQTNQHSFSVQPDSLNQSLHQNFSLIGFEVQQNNKKNKLSSDLLDIILLVVACSTSAFTFLYLINFNHNFTLSVKSQNFRYISSLPPPQI
jgi:hypothetical protein